MERRIALVGLCAIPLIGMLVLMRSSVGEAIVSILALKAGLAALILSGLVEERKWLRRGIRGVFGVYLIAGSYSVPFRGSPEFLWLVVILGFIGVSAKLFGILSFFIYFAQKISERGDAA